MLELLIAQTPMCAPVLDCLKSSFLTVSDVVIPKSRNALIGIVVIQDSWTITLSDSALHDS